MKTFKYLIKRIKKNPVPAVLTIIGIFISPIIPKPFNSFIQWLSLAPDANISTLLIIVFLLSLIVIVQSSYLFTFAKELSNPFVNYPYDESTNTCIGKNGERYCPTGITNNEKHPVRKVNGVWVCSNKNCKNSVPPTVGHQY